MLGISRVMNECDKVKDGMLIIIKHAKECTSYTTYYLIHVNQLLAIRDSEREVIR